MKPSKKSLKAPICLWTPTVRDSWAAHHSIHDFSSDLSSLHPSGHQWPSPPPRPPQPPRSYRVAASRPLRVPPTLVGSGVPSFGESTAPPTGTPLPPPSSTRRWVKHGRGNLASPRGGRRATLSGAAASRAAAPHDDTEVLSGEPCRTTTSRLLRPPCCRSHNRRRVRRGGGGLGQLSILGTRALQWS
jgi:hypothetical protein